MQKTVLIVSSGRTGTRFLAHYFDANFEGVVGRHEPPPGWRARLAGNAWAAGAIPRERALGVLAARRRRVESTLDPGARIYVESNPFLWGAVDLFDELYDGPLVVHVVRDPREQVRSALAHGTARGLKALANRWLPYWYPHAPGEALPGDWLGRAATLWKVVNERLSEHAPRCSDHLFLRYEELFDEDHSGLRALCARLELPFAGEGSPVGPAVRINRGEDDALGGWADWTDAQCETLQRIAGPLMARYGYGDEPAWRARVGGTGGAA